MNWGHSASAGQTGHCWSGDLGDRLNGVKTACNAVQMCYNEYRLFKRIGTNNQGDRMNTDLTVRRDSALTTAVGEAGQAANAAAAGATFADYRSRKAMNTLRRQDAALALFSDYLSQATAGSAPTGDALAGNPRAWAGVTWGLVEGFAKWMLLRGYAVGTVNARLSTVKTYAKLAAKAGALDPRALALIGTVTGYGRTEGKRVDERRAAADVATRTGHKKRDPVTLTRHQAEALKALPDRDTPQGRRDALLLAILLDLGLRVGELAGLAVGDFDLDARELTFYREKVDKVQVMDLTITAELWTAVGAWFAHDAPALGPVLRTSSKGGALGKPGMSKRAITARVAYLGVLAGVEGLSAHDCRHTWATLAARNGTPVDRLQDAGGWASPAMPLHYVEAARVANKGVVLE